MAKVELGTLIGEIREYIDKNSLEPGDQALIGLGHDEEGPVFAQNLLGPVETRFGGRIFGLGSDRHRSTVIAEFPGHFPVWQERLAAKKNGIDQFLDINTKYKLKNIISRIKSGLKR